MGLFTKKDPCAICGGKVKGLFPWKVDGQLICKECFSIVDLPIEEVNKMKMNEFREYLTFREENAQLRHQFQTTKTVDFGAFEDKIAFDTVNGMFCMHTELITTIFEKKDVKSFVIREDSEPLFEGSAEGLVCYTSTVPNQVAALAPEIHHVRMMREMARREEERAKRNGDDSNVSGYYPLPDEPFKQFVVEIHCDHPYWKTITADKKGPTFSSGNPNTNDYLREYREGTEIMGQLARALMEVAFPGAPERRVGSGMAPVATQTDASVDVVAEIQRFKVLMDQGILTEEEFAAKKRQLLGI